MLMDLPNHVGEVGNTKAVITENNQIILHAASYKEVVRYLVKEIYGTKFCQYCGNKIPPGKVSVEHIYPQYLGGGVELTNCLTITCMSCNGDKGDLTLDQYVELSELKKSGMSKTDIKIYKSLAKEANIKRFKETHKYQLPEGYVNYYFPIKDIEVNGKIDPKEVYNSKGYRAIKGFFNEYGYFKHPILLDKRGKLADGRRIFEFAKIEGFAIVPVIIIDNLEIWF